MIETSQAAGWWPNLVEPLQHIGQKVADWIAPRSDALARDDFYEINIELPGVKAEDVDVSIHDNNLVIHGEKRFEREEKGPVYFFSEREYGAFQRSFRLPPDANSDQIDAVFSDGVLCLKIAKQTPTQPTAKPVTIRTA